jgi:hypothetical protein
MSFGDTTIKKGKRKRGKCGKRAIKRVFNIKE